MGVKTLLLLRHAKAITGAEMADIERPLAERGVAQAVALGKMLVEWGVMPSRVWCSTARRTRQTWEGLSGAFASPPAVEYRDALYSVTQAGMLDLIQETDVESLMVVAHNPTLHQLAAALAGSGEPRLLDELHIHFPPCTLAEIAFDEGVEEGAGRLVRFVVSGQ